MPLRSEAAIWFYATFLTSFWLWLYVLAGTIVKVANNLGLVVRRFLPPLDRGRAPEVGSAM